MNEILKIEEIQKLYPDEWVLLGNPEIHSAKVMSGIVIYHSKDKKEVCYLGRDKTSGYNTVTITYSGEFKKRNRLGILRKTS
jgi:hypothetical protein